MVSIMGIRGRKPKPTGIKQLEGNPGHRALNVYEPKPVFIAPQCPDTLGPEAREEWDRLAGILAELHVLTELDLGVFAVYCDAYEQWKKATDFINTHGTVFQTKSGYLQQVPHVSIAQTYAKLMNKCAEQLGLTPSARSRIIAGSGENAPVDEMDELLGGG